VSLLTWNHACEVEVPAMDDQHGILMDTVNELRLAMTHGRGREEVSEILDRLIEFTRMHFQSEEQLMEQAAFPGLAEHRLAHQRMLAELLAAANCLQYGKFAKIQPQLSALRDSLLQHIEILDREYAPWLAKLGDG